MTAQLSGEDVVKCMVDVARRAGGEASRRDEARFEQLEARLAMQGFSHQGARGAWMGGLAAAACLVVALGGYWLYTPALTYSVVGGAIVGDSVIGSENTKIRFSDGSEVALGRGSKASIEELTADGGRVSLEQGQVNVAIVKKPDTRWFVEAGPYTVRVTGTAFDVRWSEADRSFELHLHHGSVVVTGPQIGNGFTLRPGQKLLGRAEGRVTVEGPRPASTTVSGANAAPAGSAPLAAADRADAAPSQPDARRGEANNSHTWARQVALGKFQAVIDEARRRGFDQTLATASIEDLAALADAARYASKTDLARRALLAERQRFPRSNSAREAAFFLGRLAEERGQGALEWYDRYLAESPRGPYASQALGRRMMIYYRQRGPETTLPFAREYLERFPSGPYASAARKIVGHPASKTP